MRFFWGCNYICGIDIEKKKETIPACKLACGPQESHHPAAVSDQPGQAFPFLMLLVSPGGQSFLQDTIFRLISTRAQADSIGVDFQKDRHPRID